MRSSTLRRLFLLASLALLLITGACQQQQQPAQGVSQNQQPSRERVVGTRGGSLTYRMTSPPQTFNYLMAKEEYSITTAFYLLGGRLVEFDQDQQKHVPGLAESWKWGDDDKRTLEVTLRDGLKFSDGHALTSDDLLFTMRALYDERTQSPIYRDAMMVGGKQIETSVVDARHLRMVFPETVAAPEGYLSNVVVLPRHILEEDFNKGTLKDAWSITAAPQTIVTAGPFTVEAVSPGERIGLKRNPNYWKKDSAGNQLPYLDSLTIEIIADPNNAITRLQQNSLDIIDRIRPSDYATLRSSQGNVLAHDLGPGLNVDYIWFNLNEAAQAGKPIVDPVKRAWFTDARFRRAVAYAIDRNSIVTTNLQGLATALYGFISPGNRAWVANDIPRTEYDLEKARALLREAGFTQRGSTDATELVDAKGNRVEFTMIVPVENQPRVEMAAVIQEDLARLGIKMQPAPIEFQALTARWTQSYDYDAILLGMTVTDPDPSSYTSFLQSKSGNHQWYPKQAKPATEWEARIDQLDTEQAHELDAARRKALFRDIQLILAEQLPVIPVVARHIASAANKRIGNYRPATILPFSMWNADELFVKQ
jgi:peptide/nickel transport system substrate-binding protein